MSTTTPNPEPDRARVPGWAPIPDEVLDDRPGDDPIPGDPPATDPTDATTPPPASFDQPNPNPREAGPDTGPADPSTPGSPLTDDFGADGPGRPVELSPHLDDELGALGASLADVAGRIINRAYRARTKTESRLWLVTDEEAEAFGAAASRIAARRIPDELAEEGDASDALIMGSVALGYALRNFAGEAAPGPIPADWSGTAPPPPSPQPAPPPDQPDQPPQPAPAGPMGRAPSVLTPDL